MALRVRKNGEILCAALHKAEIGDTYIHDGISEILTGCTREEAVLTTDPEPKHSMHGKWWWIGSDEVVLNEQQQNKAYQKKQKE